MKAQSFILLLVICMLACDDSGDSSGLTGTGKAGSLARFALSSTHLYAVDDESLNVYRFTETGGLEKTNQTYLGVSIETIFIKDNYLYIGSQDAMRILDITDADAPAWQSNYTHVVACDPVVVQDTLAFVTFRTNNCRAMTANALEIINIKDPRNPIQLSSYTLTGPYGLGVDGELLFVCEGDNGLCVFNVSDPTKPAMMARHTDIQAYDVIVNDGLLILTGKSGISQYSYTTSGVLQKVSQISIQQ